MGAAGSNRWGRLSLHVGAGVAAFVLAAVAVVFVATRHTATTETRTGSPTSSAASSTDVLVDLPAPVAPSDVLSAAEDGTATRAEVRAALAGLVASGKLGNHVAVTVSQLGDDRPLWSSGVPLVTPASTMKLLTTLAALQTLGPDHRFTTAVVRGGGARIVLVGGGDPLLTDRVPRADDARYPAPASLADLAAQTARELRAQDLARVRLGYDDSAFSGPAVNPAWEPSYVPESIVSPITALWVDEGRSSPLDAERVADPAAEAARRFAGLLGHRGIKVLGAPAAARAPADADELATVQSAPLFEIVQHILEVSDNEGAEVLLRHVALATGRAGTSAAGVRAVSETLTDLGVDLAGARLFDGSGLARGDLLTVGALVEVLQVAAAPDRPELRAVVSGLPVAGFSGSLDYRFVEVAPEGLGLVRAKTGTLTEAGVHGLAGVAQGPAGVFVFAAVADEVPVRKTLAARAQLDKIAAALADCC